ncbi:uncharacterized protein [Penaeus vannamei]|uniref:uncharacterized protein n=1 Tax=Penaeus vannamei TaxID=6689 RepID=UPI00387F8BB9
MEDKLHFTSLAAYVLRQLRHSKMLVKCSAALVLVAAFLYFSGLPATFRRATAVASVASPAGDPLAVSFGPRTDDGGVAPDSGVAAGQRPLVLIDAAPVTLRIEDLGNTRVVDDAKPEGFVRSGSAQENTEDNAALPGASEEENKGPAGAETSVFAREENQNALSVAGRGDLPLASRQSHLASPVGQQGNLQGDSPPLTQQANAAPPASQPRNTPLQAHQQRNIPSQVNQQRNVPSHVNQQRNVPVQTNQQRNALAQINPQRNIPVPMNPQRNSPAQINQQRKAPVQTNPLRNSPAHINRQQNALAQRNAPPQINPQRNAPPQINPQRNAPPQINPQRNAPPQINPQRNAPPQINPQRNAPAPINLQRNDNFPVLTSLSPTSRNVTPPESNVLFITAVPRCGTVTLGALLRRLSSENKFLLETPQDAVKPWMTEGEKQSLLQRLRGLSREAPVAYLRHVLFFDAARIGILKPIWMAVVRDPVERLISQFYYVRKMSSDSFIKSLDLNSCVRARNPLCFYNTGSRKMLQLSFFCGHNKKCMEVGDRRALQMAKYHAEMFYSVVGVLEDMAATYRVLRHYLPRFFMRSFRTEIVTGNQRHNAHETASTPTVLNATKALMKSFLKEDYELYYFLRQRLHLQEQTV